MVFWGLLIFLRSDVNFFSDCLPGDERLIEAIERHNELKEDELSLKRKELELKERKLDEIRNVNVALVSLLDFLKTKM